MNFLKKFIFFLILFCLNFSVVNSSEKIAFIDIDYVLNNSNIGKSIYEELEKINKNNLNHLNSKEKIIKKKKEAIEKTKNISSKEKLQKDINEFNQEVSLFKEEKDKLFNEFKIKKKKKLDKFLQEVNPIITQYMKNNSIDIVLEKNQIFIGTSSKDITLDIIKLINKTFSNNG